MLDGRSSLLCQQGLLFDQPVKFAPLQPRVYGARAFDRPGVGIKAHAAAVDPCLAAVRQGDKHRLIAIDPGRGRNDTLFQAVAPGKIGLCFGYQPVDHLQVARGAGDAAFLRCAAGQKE